jgi:hypothetical protein
MNNVPSRLLLFITVALSVMALYFLHANRFKLWFDETVQLSISHGSHPETFQPYVYGVDPATVVSLNQRYNMDPGGYSLFLNILSPIVGRHFYIYRIINILAYLTGVSLILLMLLRTFGMSRPHAIMLTICGYLIFLMLSRRVLIRIPGLDRWVLDQGFGLFPFYSLLKRAFIIRSYGFEVLFISFVLFMGSWFANRNVKGPMVILTSMMLGILLTRYDFSIFVFCYFGALALYVRVWSAWKELIRSKWTWIFSISILTSLYLLYIYSYSHQTAGVGTPSRLPYLADSYLDSLRNWRFVFGQPRNILASVMFATAIMHILSRTADFLEYIYITVFIGYLSLSVLGLHPFNFSLSQCSAMIIMMDVLLVKWVLGMLSAFRNNRSISRMAQIIISDRLRYSRLIFTFLLSAWVVASEFSTKRVDALISSILAGPEATMEAFDKTIDSVLVSNMGAKIFLDRTAIPNINCFYSLSGRPIPANDYRFEMLGPHSQQLIQVTGISERFENAIQSQCDLYYVPELNFNNAQRKKFATLGFVESPSCKHLYTRAQGSIRDTGQSLGEVSVFGK